MVYVPEPRLSIHVDQVAVAGMLSRELLLPGQHVQAIVVQPSFKHKVGTATRGIAYSTMSPKDW